MEKILDDIRRDAITKLKLVETNQQPLLINAALTIITLSNTARREGLLALEEALKENESDFLTLTALLIIDGTDPELVIEIAANEYWTKEPQGIEAMIAYFYLRGMISIQSGENPQILEKLLLSLIPLAWRQEYQKQLETAKEKSKLPHLNEIYEKFATIYPIFQEESTLETISILEQQIHTLPNPFIQRIIRDIENNDLSICVYALSKDSRKKIFHNLSTRLANIIMEDIVSYRSISEKDVSKSILKVLSVIHTLRETGEIYAPIESDSNK